MLSDKFRDYMDDRVSSDQALLVALALKTLPASDVAVVSRQVLESYACHGLFLRENSPYCRQIPEDIFLHYVFYPRVNSEDITDCRPFFYEKLAPVVAGRSGGEAALAVNRWCAAQMTYESTDARTISPMTAYSCGLGRCGEESVFAVTAFRSVGIPARQIYVPWWSHCDDNHAWVEVYVEGAWHFLGACEPEPILDRGWFSGAATRAMVACSRSFFAYGLEDEAVIDREGQCLHYNQIARYADTVTVTITVTARGEPVSGALLRLGVLNMADFASVATLETDARGRASLETGLGSLLVEAQKGALYGFASIMTAQQQEWTLELQPGAPEERSWTLDFQAPAAGVKTRTTLTAAQQAQKQQVLEAARQQRQARIVGYFLPEYRKAPEKMQQILRMAGGNAAALWAFYQSEGDRALTLLETLAPKDYRDARPEVLGTFLGMAQGPRIGYEVLQPWKAPILQLLTPAQQACFREDPGSIWPWIREHYREKGLRFYDPLWLSPAAAVALGAADEKGRRLLFVAVCRTLGIPARLDPVDGRPQVWRNGSYELVEAQEPQPAVTVEIDGSLPYFQAWTLARWEGGFRTLDLTGAGSRCRLPKGLYRLITTNRLPNGNQLAAFRVFRLEGDEKLSVQLRQASPRQMLADYPVPLASCPLQLRVYLEVGAEPTEHALNELLEVKDPGIPVHLVVRTPQEQANPTLQKVLRTVSGVELEVADFADGSLESLARALYLEPGVWPLLVLTDGKIGYYSHCGYGVNTVPLALRLAEQV